MEGRLLLDVVVRQGSAVLELLSGKDQTLLVRRDSFLVLNLSLDIFNSVRRLNLKSDGLASKSLDKDLHLQSKNINIQYMEAESKTYATEAKKS